MSFGSKSIGARFGAFAGGMVAVLCVALFTMYAFNQKESVLKQEVHASRNLVLMAESVRENMEGKWKLGLFSAQIVRESVVGLSGDERKQKLVAAVPVVAAWESAKAKSKEGGFEFRTPRENARNKANEPDAIEAEVLREFARDTNLKEKHVVDEKTNTLRYFRPVRLSETCLNCHGDPARSYELWRRDDGKDITGYAMDNKKVGDLHGAFEVIRPLGEADAALRNSLLSGLAIVIPVIVLSLVLLFRMVRRMVTQPLDQAVETCAAIAEGDLSRSMETDRQDEIGRLLTALRTMSERLRNVVGQVTEGSQAIVLGADQIAAGNENLSQRTEEQASSLEETAASMEEMTGSVKQNAENAQAASRVADEARKASQQGSEVVQKAIVAMGEINTASEKIRDIIATIDGIAFQTNLLALNAAVEAARAGEQGRGFAVVASEVRALAQRAASSAKEIKVLIEDSVAKVGAGTALVDQSGVTLSEITANIRKAADIMSEISASSAEQASGVDQVSTAVSQMDDMTQQNAALVEEASAASRAMREQAQALYETMGFFKTGAARMASATSDRAALVAPSSPARSMTAGAERRSPARPLMGKPVSKRAATPDSHKDEHLQKLRSGQAQAARKAAGDEGEWEKF